MPRQRIQDPEIRKQQILKAAQAVLSSKPYSHLVMDDIAREAGISKGLLYLYFKDKESLFEGVAHDLLDQLTEHLKEIEKKLTSTERLKKMVTLVLEFGENHKEFTTQFVPEQILSSGRGAKILDGYESFLELLGNFFKDGIRDGVLKPHSIRSSAMITMEIIMLYVRRKYIHKEIDGPLMNQTSEILGFILSGFGSQKRPAK